MILIKIKFRRKNLTEHIERIKYKFVDMKQYAATRIESAAQPKQNIILIIIVYGQGGQA